MENAGLWSLKLVVEKLMNKDSNQTTRIRFSCNTRHDSFPSLIANFRVAIESITAACRSDEVTAGVDVVTIDSKRKFNVYISTFK